MPIARTLRPLTLTGCLLALPVLGGCLIGSHSSSRSSGTYVGPATLAQIKPGQTRQDFVLATLGEPTRKTTMSDGAELWRYSYSRSSASSGHVLVLLSASSKEQSEAVTFVQFRDGVVERAWQDRSGFSSPQTVDADGR
jgi:outer membrane protein assembly factor BamE (lipoprotein component of BamABCDE complex)